MKNKRHLIVLTIVFTISTLLFGQQQSRNPLLNGDEIVLQGELETGIGPDDIGASVDDYNVQVCFSRSFGNVTLSLYNSNGILIYNGVINTDIQQLAVIPISGYASGTYTLVLSNGNGVAEGEFDR